MAYEFGSISKRMKARKPKTKVGRGVAAGAEGFLKGVQQGMQMGMYRAMQQQKAGETENEKLASHLTVFQRSVNKESAPELYAEITRDILFLNTGGHSITPDMRATMSDKYKGQMTGAVVAKPPEPEKIEAPEEEYHTFALTGTVPYTPQGSDRTYQPGERISVKKSDVEAGGLSGSPFQFIGPTSTVSAVTPAPPRPPTPRAPALYIDPTTKEITSVSSRGTQYVTDTGKSISAEDFATYIPFERKAKQYRYEKLDKDDNKIASQLVTIETIPTAKGLKYIARTDIPSENLKVDGKVVKEDGKDRHIKAGDDITDMWPTISWQFKSRMEEPWKIMYTRPMSGGDIDSDDDLDRQTKEAFK